MKKIAFGLLILLGVSVVGACWFTFREKQIVGTIVDCLSNQPIKNAEVAVSQIGWGFEPYPSKEKIYTSNTKTDQAGNFQISYRLGGIAHLEVKKKGYVTARQQEYPKPGVIVRMLQGDQPKEVTYNCRLLSQCYQSSFENGASVTVNLCQQDPVR